MQSTNEECPSKCSLQVGTAQTGDTLTVPVSVVQGTTLAVRHLKQHMQEICSENCTFKPDGQSGSASD